MILLEIIHLIILFYLSLGGYFIPIQYIPVFLLSLPYIVIDWNDKDGLCWITKLTNMVKYGDINPEVEDEVETSFIRKWLSKLGITIDKQKLTFLLYSILTSIFIDKNNFYYYKKFKSKSYVTYNFICKYL